MGFNCLKAIEPLRGGSLLFTTQFPKIPGTDLIDLGLGTHLIDLGRMKGWVNLRATSGFEHWTPGLGSSTLTTRPMLHKCIKLKHINHPDQLGPGKSYVYIYRVKKITEISFLYFTISCFSVWRKNVLCSIIKCLRFKKEERENTTTNLLPKL